MKETPRILWNAKDAPWLNSGYGIITRYLTPLLAERYGEENIIIYAPVYQKDCRTKWQGMDVVSGISFDYGENIILDHYRYYHCNMLLTIGDAWPLGIVPDLAAKDELLWIQWLPVDWLGMPKNIYNRIRYAHKLVPFSKDGEARVRQAGLPNVEPAIWLGLDTELWKPIPREDLPDVMKLVGYEYDTFNILIVAANQERKNVREQLEAIHLFRKANPQVPARLYLHSHMRGGDRDLLADCDELDLGDILVYPDPYIMTQGGAPEETMCKIFNCAGVVLNVCMEGFGLPIIQAQACGVMVVYLTEGPGPELIKAGVGTPPMAADTYPNMMTKPIPNPVAIAHALEEIWKRQVERGAPLRSEKAIKFVQENFSWQKIAAQWFEVIDRVMQDRETYCYGVPAPSEKLKERAKEEVILI